MPTLMVLGANTLQLPLIHKVKERGYTLVLISPNPKEPGFKFADHCIFADVSDKETILKYAKKYKIEGIITDQTDIPVRTVAYVAEQMGLPGIGYQTACLFTNKFLMREKCRELGIPTLKYALVDTLDEALMFFKKLNNNAIIKPVDCQGSKGVSRVINEQQLKEKFSEALSYSKTKQVLLEQFVTGREFVVEGIAYDYQFQNLIIGDTYYFDIPNVFSATTRIFPSCADKTLVERVKELNSKIITGFGLKQGITHSEFIMHGDEIYLIETAARGGGVFISSDLISLSTNLSTEDFLISIATGTLERFPEIKYKSIACCYIAFYLPVGEVISVEGVGEVQKMPFTHRNNLDEIYVGMRTKPYTDKTSRYFVIVSAINHQELSDRVGLIREKLKIKVITHDGVQGPIWS